MRRTQVRNPRLAERLHSLQRELSRVEGNIESLAKAVENPDREDALRRLQQLNAELDRSKAEPKPDIPPQRLTPREFPFEQAPVPPDDVPAVHRSPAAPLAEEAGLAPKTPSDQRFANYFVTGGLHSVRPLRQERRVQRNKAIVMVIIAALVLYGVIQLLSR